MYFKDNKLQTWKLNWFYSSNILNVTYVGQLARLHVLWVSSVLVN